MATSSRPGPLDRDPGAERNAAFELGRRLRHLRKQQGLTLVQAGEIAGVAASQMSLIENGKREARVTTLQRLATQYHTSLDQLTGAEPPSRRAALEIALERHARSPLARARNLPTAKIGPRLPMDALETMVALHQALEQDAAERIATPEEARRANAELRGAMRARDNYFAEIEGEARSLLEQVGYARGPLSAHLIGALTDHLGFSVHHVPDLPHSTRSVTDLRQHRIYLTQAPREDHDPRSVLLQALGHHVLGHQTPAGYGDFLRQRVETNYFAAALLLPEQACMDVLGTARSQRQIAVEDLRDTFAVSYETAAHRLTNLLTHHLDIPVHFMKVHEGGIIYKAYENDDVDFPADPTGAIEGQRACRYWTSRVVFGVPDTLNSYYAFTDTPTGTYWCTARIDRTAGGDFSTCIGVPYAHAKWFRGAETTERSVSRCPDETCCRRPPPELASTWSGQALPSARAHSHLLAALPPGVFPGVDETEVYTFLQDHMG